MGTKYKVVFLITSLLIILSISISFINYSISYYSVQKQLKNQTLPLFLNNVYLDIQKHIVKPHIISSTMANNSFLKNWLKEESNTEKIKEYLFSIKKDYDLFNTFLVSEKTKKYYTKDGVLEVINEKNPLNAWYFDFKESDKNHEMNLDLNKFMSDDLIIFINYKIYDENSKLLGVTGVSLKTLYINKILKTFRTHKHFIVSFYNKNGQMVLSEKYINSKYSDSGKKSLSKFKQEILSKDSSMLEYKENGNTYILNSKYIPELDLYLTVETNLENFTYNITNVLYFNMIVSFLVTAIIAFLVYLIIKNYSKKIEFLSQHDPLTKVSNRRDFELKLNTYFNLMKRKRNDICLIFIDIDDFKSLNDKLGHHIGDKVLVQFANIMQSEIRKTDLFARWGGEEFLIALIDSNISDTTNLTEKLRMLIENDIKLNKLTKTKVTASFGITKLEEDDTIEEAISRADKAMYLSKNEGKNQVSIL
ncbi:GGDEF domain-containing protein [Arcobacter sp. CECT 8983]|uniref:sensor domain-containing diguanylate cyclase n=1 Tax=Arcobacter sp. CECT 8983 TaxID=2044508 RepID=UPI00100C1F19|nr:sensor domain-containing diguanylate cyclase [Arcobacter sp. CECT 8983]RXJ88733.1 GGDEF domain-containing protein [Arcobacter sp. CECT 8983]